MAVPDLILNWNLTPDGGAPFDLVLDHSAPVGTSVESVTADYYFKYTDDPDAPWQFLATGVVGQDLEIPIALEPGEIVIKGETRTAYNQTASKGTDAGTSQITYTVPGARPAGVEDVMAGEDLTAGNTGFVNLYLAAGVNKARKANATDNTKPCDGYILDNIATGALGTVYKTRGDLITGLSGLTIGTTYYLSTTGGQITATPAQATGNIIQEIGQAVSATELVFDPQPWVTVA